MDSAGVDKKKKKKKKKGKKFLGSGDCRAPSLARRSEGREQKRKKKKSELGSTKCYFAVA